MHRALVVLLLLSGCAFALDGPDPDRPRSQAPQCDTGKGVVVLDGAMAATSGLVALTVADSSEPALALLPLSIGALYVAGAISGNRAVNKCRAAMGDYESYLAARGALPPPDEAVPRKQPRRAIGATSPASPTRPAAEPAPAAAAPAMSAAVVPAAPPPALQTTTPAAAVPAPASAPAAPSAAETRAAAPVPAAQPARDAEDDWSAFWREVE